MNKLQKCLVAVVAACTMGGCATIPPGPSVMVLPGAGKSFATFRADDQDCRSWAEAQTGWNANDTVNQNVVAGSAIGTVLGAGLGAVIGSASGNMGAGAGIGAVSGLIGGAAVSSGQAQSSGMEVQRRYDIAYQQCMYSKGNQIPGSRGRARSTYVPPPPPPSYPSAPDASDGAYPPPD